MSKNGNIQASRQQLYIHQVIGGVLNYNDNTTGYYSLDVAYPEEKIAVEYDGSGHFLRVKFGNASMDECIKHDEEREKYLIDKGYKIIRFIHNGKKLPPDETIINIFNDCLSKLDSEKIIKIDFDNL